MNTLRKWLVRILVIQVVIWGLVPLCLIYLAPKPKMSDSTKLDFDTLPAQMTSAPPALKTYQARDGASLQYREFVSQSPNVPLMVLVHGSGWHSLGYHEMADAIANSGAANVITPDLRGHGETPQRRGDVDYIGQLEDDIADLIKFKKRSAQKLILAGHSSGGGFAIRFAGGPYGNMLDGAVLLAPFIHHASKTNQPNGGAWAYPMLPRIIGLSMQNMIGIHAWDYKTVIHFNHPKAILSAPNGNTATKAYSHRLLTSFNPRDGRFNWTDDVAKLPPFLLMVGEKDEAFKAEQYEPMLSPHTEDGRYEIVPNLNHSTILIDPRPVRSIVRFIERL